IWLHPLGSDIAVEAEIVLLACAYLQLASTASPRCSVAAILVNFSLHYTITNSIVALINLLHCEDEFAHNMRRCLLRISYGLYPSYDTCMENKILSRDVKDLLLCLCVYLHSYLTGPILTFHIEPVLFPVL
ncbi:hypothetical protein ACJX0J_020945, partial [Zea mays]